MVISRLIRASEQPDPEAVDLVVKFMLDGRSVPLPMTGVLNKSFAGDGSAPLEIKTRPGSNYFLKVVDWTTKAKVLTAFIRGGEPFETKVPVGSYEIRYATGQTWYGLIFDFGEGASYARCDDRFDFHRTAYGFSGYTVELILQINGNLKTAAVAAEEF